jgi:phage-related protein (TIGR01555 family)
MNAFSGVRQDGMMGVMNRVAGERQRYGLYNGSQFNADYIYALDGLAQTIVDKPAEDCMSVGFTVDGDLKNDILNEFDRLEAIPIITDCFRWARLHGGAAILVFIDDGLPLTEPVNYDRINLIEDLIDYPANSIFPVAAQRYADPTKKNYGLPAIYELRPKIGNTFFVHESRLINIPGEPLPPSLLSTHILPWVGRSALEACYVDIMRYKDGLKLSKGILERKVQLVHKMSNLGEMLAQGMDEIVAQRLNIADSVRGVYNMLAVDALDDVVLADTQLSGIDAVLKDYRIALCASSRLPQAILFGEQTGGLHANAEGEKSIYHSLLDGMRQRRLRPAIEQMARFIWSQKQLHSKEPERWQVVMHPLAVPSADQIASVKLKEAQARKTDMEAVQIGLDARILIDTEARQVISDIYPNLEIDVSETVMPEDSNISDVSTSGGSLVSEP